MIAGLSDVASPATATADAKVTLATLPNDVLLHIWTQLDEPDSWLLTSQRFRKLSKDTLWRAKWFMQRYRLYEVLFEAIARPKIFTSEVLDRLIRLGAPLSRNLVQMLYYAHNKVSRDNLIEQAICWGHIGFKAYSAVMYHAGNLYGDDISFELAESDSSLFFKWLIEREAMRMLYSKAHKDPENDEAIRQLFRDGFMPLALAFRWSAKKDQPWLLTPFEDGLTRAIEEDSGLVVLATQNGFLPTPSVADIITKAWIRDAQDPDEVTPLLQYLSVNGILQVSQDFVFDIYEQLSYLLTGKEALLTRLVAAAPTQSAVVHEYLELPFSDAMGNLESLDQPLIKQEAIADLCVRLDEKLALPFRLHEVQVIVAVQHRVEEARHKCQHKLRKLNQILGKEQSSDIDQRSKSGID